MRLMKRKGQSTLEYLVILAIVIAIIVVVATGVFKSSTQSVYNRAGRRADNIINAGNLFGDQ